MEKFAAIRTRLSSRLNLRSLAFALDAALRGEQLVKVLKVQSKSIVLARFLLVFEWSHALASLAVMGPQKCYPLEWTERSVCLLQMPP